MGKVEICFYETKDGKFPAAEFIQSLDAKMESKMIRIIDFLAENDGELREPYSKPLGDGIFELRAQVGNNITRVLYFFFVGNKAVLTHGFVKKTQKTPSKEIKKAKQYRSDYQERNGNQ